MAFDRSPQILSVPLHDREQEYASYGAADASAHDTIVMVHGLRGTWQGLDRIARALPDFRVVIPTLPGFGGAEDIAGGNTIGNYAAWLDEFTAALGLSGHVILGHSFGSIVVAQSADPHVRATILVNPVAVPARLGPHPVASRGAKALYQLAAALPENAGNWILRAPIHVRIMSVMMAKTRSSELRTWIHRQHDTYYDTYTSRTGVVEAFNESITRSVSDNAARLNTPTLLIAGELDDIATPADQIELAASIADSELHVIPGVGHLIHYETPEVAASLISDYLARH